MPLIILTGNPCSGKSTRTEELRKYFSDERRKQVTVVSENRFADDRNSTFSDSQKEKAVRSAVKSEALRNLHPDCVVIIDAGNYIKGYRYELYCMAKESKSSQCTIHCQTSIDQIRQWNASRSELRGKYADNIISELTLRYEEPDSRNRWDSPLFTILPDGDLPLSEIFECLFSRKTVKSNMSTQAQPLSSSNYLHDLDKVTKSVVLRILDGQKLSWAVGDPITVDGCKEKVSLNRKMNLSQLTRLQKQFLTYCKMHPKESAADHVTQFVLYINGNAAS